MSSFGGVYRGIVARTDDPEGRGRITVIVPAVNGTGELAWAMPCAPSGFLTLPALGTPVWVMFEHGDPDAPVWLGTWLSDSAGSGGSTALSANAIYGDGIDGDWVAPSGLTVLTTNKAFHNLHVPADAVIDTASYIITVSGTFSGSGLIHANGNDAVGGTRGNRRLDYNLHGAFGAPAGSSTNIVGTGEGGAGGDSWTGPVGAGTGGPLDTNFAYHMGLHGDIVFYIAEYTNGGTGGGGGAYGDAPGGAGGGGGSGVWLAARTVTFTGDIQCKGGKGGDSPGTGAGGGGGGSGGYLVFIAETGVHLPIVSTAGGAGGLGGEDGGNGVGYPGIAGGSGVRHIYTIGVT